MASLTISHAARRCGVARRTLQRAIKAGRLALTPDHQHWRGQPDGTQTGFFVHDIQGRQVGVMAWQAGTIAVRHNDGSVFRDCGTSHEAAFVAASELVAFSQAAEDA